MSRITKNTIIREKTDSGLFNEAQMKEIRLVKEMRSIIDRSHPRFSGTAAVIFNSLFPPEEPAFYFDKSTIKQENKAKYTDTEQTVAKAATKAFGYISASTSTVHGAHEVQNLNVGFSTDKKAFVNVVNKLPFIHGLYQGQVQPIGMKEGGGTIITRELHSMHLANTVLRDLVRMAQKDTELFMEQVERDMKFYGVDMDTLRRVKVQIPETEIPDGYPQHKRDAVHLAMQYGTYLVLFAYLHDERTPGLGDGVMKAKARFTGQKSVNYSEDEELQKGIGAFARRTSSKLPELFSEKNFNLDTDLFVKITQDLASERGKTLGAQLMKNKRKFIKEPDDRLSEVFLNEEMFSDPASLDLDQASGLLINMYDLASTLLPGGFRFSSKVKDGEEKVPPLIGSYTDRLMLLMYANITGMAKEELEAKLRERKIAPERVYITAEEFIIGANFSLKKIPELGDAIIQVAHNPVTVKRMMQTFAALTYFVYNSDSFHGTERMVQDIITALYYQDPETIETFINRSDYDALDILTRNYTGLIDHIYSIFPDKMERVTEDELRKRVEGAKGHAFYSRAKLYPVKKKEGTFVQTAHGSQPYAPNVDLRVNFASGRTLDNPYALPKKLAQIEEDLNNHAYYHYLELSEEEVQEIKRIIATSPKGPIRSVLTRVMRYWELPLQLSDKTILKKDNDKIQFRLQSELPFPDQTQMLIPWRDLADKPPQRNSIYDPPELEDLIYIHDAEQKQAHYYDDKK